MARNDMQFVTIRMCDMRANNNITSAQYYFEILKKEIAASGDVIFRYTYPILEAVPAFISMQFKKQSSAQSKAPPVFWHILLLLGMDIIPMIVILIMQTRLIASSNSTEEKSSLQSLLAYFDFYLICLVGTALMMRQKISFFIHATILSIAYSKSYAELTDKTREKVDTAVCKTCTPGRFLKGDLRAVVVFITQTMMIQGMELIPGVGFLFALFSRIFLMGQVVTEYRLGNDGICDRHRAEYFHQHHKFIFMLGFMHYIATQLVAYQTKKTFGIDQSQIEGSMSTIMMLLFIGLAHHMSFPQSISKATRHCYDPLMIMRICVSETLDLIMPGMKKLFEHTIEKKKEGRHEKMSWEKIRSHVISFYHNKTAKWAIKLLLPSLCRDIETLKTDPIIKHYWPSIAELLAEYMGRILAMRDPALKLNSLRDFYINYITPVQEVADILGFCLAICTPVILPIRIIAKSVWAISGLTGLQNQAMKALPAVAHRNDAVRTCMEFINSMPKGVGFLIIALLRNETFIADFKAAQKHLINAAGEYYSQEVKEMPVSSRLMQSTDISEWVEVRDVSVVPHNPSHDNKKGARLSLFQCAASDDDNEFERIPEANSEEFNKTYGNGSLCSQKAPGTPGTEPTFHHHKFK